MLGSATKAADSEVLDTLRAMKKKYRRIVLLLDPDVAGRQARNEIESKISGCWHAFVPTLDATAKEDKKYKEEGDVGVEHANADTVVRAIFRSRQLTDSNLYSRDGLISVGLIAPMHSRVSCTKAFSFGLLYMLFAVINLQSEISEVLSNWLAAR